MQPIENLGQGVYRFNYRGNDKNHITKTLPQFKKEHPELVVTAIVPILDSNLYHQRSVVTLGWLINCEKKS